MADEAKLWDIIHQKTYKADDPPSEYAEKVEKLFPRNSLVADLGTGTGADALYFLKNGHSVIALDISEFALKKLQEKVKSTNLSDRLVVIQVDFSLQPLPLKDSSIDIAYSRISLNYFTFEQTGIIFKDIYRSLKSGGKAFLTLKSPDDVEEMRYLEKTASYCEPNVFIKGSTLRSRFTQEQLKEILNSVGIEGKVTPLKENLRKKGEELNPILYVNEVTFEKR